MSSKGHHGEAESAESRRDFIHKLRVCHQELREARHWLRLTQRASLIADPELLAGLLAECEELIRIFTARIRTTEKNGRESGRQ